MIARSVLSLLLIAPLAKGAVLDPSACAVDSRSEVLQSVPEEIPAAKAVWAGPDTVLWQGNSSSDGDGRFALLHAEDGDLRTGVGRIPSGFDLSIPLRLDQRKPAMQGWDRFAYLGNVRKLAFELPAVTDWATLLRGETRLVQLDAQGRVREASGLQVGQLLDALYADAADRQTLGAMPDGDGARFALWAPSARRVELCLFPGPEAAANLRQAMHRDADSGIWTAETKRSAAGSYYLYRVEVFVPGIGWVLNTVTDPYAVSLSADSRRTALLDLGDASTRPHGWLAAPRPAPAGHAVDSVVYELHVRDFSIADPDVPEAHRGRYLAFTDVNSSGMRHLRSLHEAGVTDLHLMPVFDIASIPERGCLTPTLPTSDDPEALQSVIGAVRDRDCYNWGYDPLHYGAPEGSYASNANDAAVRVRELRAAIQALHGIGLRVGMDVVYNHTPASGLQNGSVLDRIVPGYYQRLNASGEVERSTCCANTATERRMMAKLMIDTAVRWARDYRIDAFRFDLMGHQPREAMERLQVAVDAAAGRHIALIGEGWNFGEIADGARFVQAAQGRLDGSGIGSFNDRGRDAVRGGGCCDSGDALLQPGWSNGLVERHDPQATAELAARTDWVRATLAGSIRDVELPDASGQSRRLDAIDYKGQPAGFVSQPDEVVNYVSNHDNLTLFDNSILRMPQTASTRERAEVQVLGAAVVAFSQGIAYFHAGIEVLRSKSLDRNSFNSGDAFNLMDWAADSSRFGIGLPPAWDNRDSWPQMRPRIADPALVPDAATRRWTEAAFGDLLRIRAGTPLLRLPDAAAIRQRLHGIAVDASRAPGVVAQWIDGRGLPDVSHDAVLLLFNASASQQQLAIAEACARPWQLHPLQASASAADQRPRGQSTYDAESNTFDVPARSALVFVIPAGSPGDPGPCATDAAVDPGDQS